MFFFLKNSFGQHEKTILETFPRPRPAFAFKGAEDTMKMMVEAKNVTKAEAFEAIKAAGPLAEKLQ